MPKLLDEFLLSLQNPPLPSTQGGNQGSASSSVDSSQHRSYNQGLWQMINSSVTGTGSSITYPSEYRTCPPLHELGLVGDETDSLSHAPLDSNPENNTYTTYSPPPPEALRNRKEYIKLDHLSRTVRIALLCELLPKLEEQAKSKAIDKTIDLLLTLAVFDDDDKDTYKDTIKQKLKKHESFIDIFSRGSNPAGYCFVDERCTYAFIKLVLETNKPSYEEKDYAKTTHAFETLYEFAKSGKLPDLDTGKITIDNNKELYHIIDELSFADISKIDAGNKRNRKQFISLLFTQKPSLYRELHSFWTTKLATSELEEEQDTKILASLKGDSNWIEGKSREFSHKSKPDHRVIVSNGGVDYKVSRKSPSNLIATHKRCVIFLLDGSLSMDHKETHETSLLDGSLSINHKETHDTSLWDTTLSAMWSVYNTMKNDSPGGSAGAEWSVTILVFSDECSEVFANHNPKNHAYTEGKFKCMLHNARNASGACTTNYLKALEHITQKGYIGPIIMMSDGAPTGPFMQENDLSPTAKTCLNELNDVLVPIFLTTSSGTRPTPRALHKILEHQRTIPKSQKDGITNVMKITCKNMEDTFMLAVDLVEAQPCGYFNLVPYQWRIDGDELEEYRGYAPENGSQQEFSFSLDVERQSLISIELLIGGESIILDTSFFVQSKAPQEQQKKQRNFLFPPGIDLRPASSNPHIVLDHQQISASAVEQPASSERSLAPAIWTTPARQGAGDAQYRSLSFNTSRWNKLMS